MGGKGCRRLFKIQKIEIDHGGVVVRNNGTISSTIAGETFFFQNDASAATALFNAGTLLASPMLFAPNGP